MSIPRFCFSVQALLAIGSNRFLDPYVELARLKINPVGLIYTDRLSPPHYCYSVDEIENKFKVKFKKENTMTFSQSLRIKFFEEQKSIEAIEIASKREKPRKAKRSYVAT